MSQAGDKYGKLEILSINSAGRWRMALCRCECGSEKLIRLAHVTGGITVSCGCIKRKHKVEIGQRFGRLVVESLEYSRENGRLKVPVACDCGTRKHVGVAELATGVTRSCGCLVVENLVSMSFKHGGERTALYSVWHGMKVRCSNVRRENYPGYGGRGISVCDKWQKDFAEFRLWAESSGYRKGLQIDRIDVNGNYEPSNCRWVTAKINGNNRRDNVFLTAFGETKTMKQWSEDDRCVVSYVTLKHRISRSKWPHEAALTTPPRN